MKILLVILLVSLALESPAVAQFAKQSVSVEGSLNGNKLGGADLFFYEADKTFSVPVPAKDIKNIMDIFTMMHAVTSASVFKKYYPFDISVDIKSTGPAIKVVTYEYPYVNFAMSYEDYRSAMSTLRAMINLQYDLILRKINEWPQYC